MSESGRRLVFASIAILSLAGVVVSGISVQRHYARSASGFCDLSQQLNCDIVNRSEFSEVEGIPVAAIGVLGYGALFGLSTFWKSRRETPNQLLIAASVGMAFALYLTYVEAYKLRTWCILCLASQALIFIITVLACVVKLRSARL